MEGGEEKKDDYLLAFSRGEPLTLTEPPRVHFGVISRISPRPTFFSLFPFSSFHTLFDLIFWASSWVPIDPHCLRRRCRIDQSTPFQFPQLLRSWFIIIGPNRFATCFFPSSFSTQAYTSKARTGESSLSVSVTYHTLGRFFLLSSWRLPY